MERLDGVRKLLLLSNSTVHGSGYLDHAEQEIRGFVGSRIRVVFIPFAMYDRGAYAMRVRARLHEMRLSLTSIHDVSNRLRAVAEADVIFGGGRKYVSVAQGTS